MLFFSKAKTGIGGRISRLVAVSVFTAMMLLAAILMINQVRESISAKHKSVEAVGYVFASALAEKIEQQNRTEIQLVLRSLARLPDIFSAFALDKNGATLASMGSGAILQSNLVNNAENSWQYLTKGNMPVSVDIIRGGTVAGKLVLIADISDIRQHLLWNLLSTLVASLIAATLAVPLSRPLQSRIAKPIIDLTASIKNVRETRSFQPADIAGAEGETLMLVENFNGMINDIQNRDLALRKLAYFDPLTGLPNRVNFQKHLELILKQSVGASNRAIFILDIDNFHALNDAMGHSLGDALLMNVAALLNDATSESDFIARIGGDEFAISVSDVSSLQEAQAALAKFISTLYRPIRLLGHELHLTASVGAVLLPTDGDNVSDIQRNLDLALHEAKRSGPGHVYFYKPELSNAITEEAELVSGLRVALQEDGLEVHYQPIVDLGTGKVSGFEALVRWNHPVRGMISPAKFIPMAEKSGLISPLGDWVLKTACLEAKAWIDQGEPPRSVAVNISAAQMLQSDFLEKVQNALLVSGFPAHLLCLELTESLFVGKAMNTVQKLLQELKALGIQTALDDFGTGYSSLSYLENLPFDKLKIDRAFIKSLGKGQKNIDLLQGIIDLAHALGMKVVAEGAEKANEVKILAQLKADHVQGYYFAKPSTGNFAIVDAAEIDEAASVAKNKYVQSP